MPDLSSFNLERRETSRKLSLKFDDGNPFVA